MKGAFHVVLFLVTVAGIGSAQGVPADPNERQIELAKILRKDSIMLEDISISNCRVSFNSENAILTITNQNAKTSTGGGFPSDESNVYLSSGPDRDETVPLILTRFKFRLQDIDAAKVTVQKSGEQGVSLVVLNTVRDEMLIDLSRFGKTLKTINWAVIRAKTKSAEKVAEAIRNAVEGCS